MVDELGARLTSIEQRFCPWSFADQCGQLAPVFLTDKMEAAISEMRAYVWPTFETHQLALFGPVWLDLGQVHIGDRLCLVVLVVNV
jgi:hypothetical protein